ncbi:MAG: DUF885 domain-containing protein [Lachnospiraceae bacterium]|nr:DUF885 domain-containing protein [Lachnospiraceae bacterium]
MRRHLYKGIIPGIFCLLLLLFFLVKVLNRTTFDDFSTDFFRHEVSQSTISLHYTLADPSAYGIEETEAIFGLLNEEEAAAEQAWLRETAAELREWLNRGLEEKDETTARVLLWWVGGQLEADNFYYYQEPLAPTLGVQAQLPVLLAEFPFRCREDIDIYLELIEKLPQYFAELAAFEREKSALGLFMRDELLEQVLEQCCALTEPGSSHYLVESFQERLENCDFLTDDQRFTYEVKNQAALLDGLLPAYEQLSAELEALRGTGTNDCGLCCYEDGLSYYQYLLRYSVGTDRDLENIEALLEEQIADDYETILYAISEGENLLEEPASDSSPAEILASLQEQIRTDFPESADISWQIREVPVSLQDFLSPAFYLTPAIDAAEENTIYVNPSYETAYVNMVTTLAHEGYPGHLYQHSFESALSPARSVCEIGGYTEGWGLYSELYAYDFLGLSEPKADALRALSSLNYAVCASLDLYIHSADWTEADCVDYLAAFGITDAEQLHSLYLNILAEPSNYMKYYLGYLEICELKESFLQLSPDHSVYDFHNWFLETGPAPFSILEDLLNKEEDTSKISKILPQLQKRAG